MTVWNGRFFIIFLDNINHRASRPLEGDQGLVAVYGDGALECLVNECLKLVQYPGSSAFLMNNLFRF